MAQKLLHFRASDRSGQLHRNTQPEFILFHDPGEMLAFTVDFTFSLGAGQLRTSTRLSVLITQKMPKIK
jgi:hypothetical protein